MGMAQSDRTYDAIVIGVHGCPNVFVTDGACMTSTGNQSRSILYVALTARAANHAVDELKRRNL